MFIQLCVQTTITQLLDHLPVDIAICRPRSHPSLKGCFAFRLQANPPKPTNDEVLVGQEDEACFFVASFGGWPSEGKFLEAAQSLVALLQKLQRSFNASSYFTASYDAPFRLINRHNELWIQSSDQS